MAGGPRFGVSVTDFRSDCQRGGDDPEGSSPRSDRASPPVAVRWQGRIVGHVADGVFVRRVQASHILRTPPAIALHDGVLDELDRFRVEVVEFHLDDGSILAGPLDLYHGPRSFVVDRGWGAQRAVRLADFLRVEVRQAERADVLAFGAVEVAE